ncbi:MAG: RimK family alpha-L-glutamate ligase [Gemmatimonadaceae bacterium]
MVYNGIDRDAVVSSLTARAAAAPDAAALMDLSMLLQLAGERETGLELQAQALGVSRIYRCVHGSGAGLRVLALFAAGDFMANTPLDFLLDGSDATVHYLYVSPGVALPAALPDHDVAFLGVAESNANARLLDELVDLESKWPRPMLNCHASAIADMTRDRLWERFQSSDQVLAPRNARTTRAELMSVASGARRLEELLSAESFPIIVRPLDSHAGSGLARVEDAADLTGYLHAQVGDTFYIAPFVDYRSADGQFRKYRIVFVAGHAYIAHLAISGAWMVHYLNAGMHESAAKREEEAACMARFDHDFGARHQLALAAVAQRIGLDYFAIDCAEAPDGRLLLFEAGTGMIVHAMDPVDMFPYKQVQMREIFRAFLEMLDAAAR